MKIGMIRHFKVTRGYPNKYVNTNELLQWMKEYDESAVEEIDLDMKQIEWKRCYSSDLPRARATAEKAFSGSISYRKELREISLAPFLRLNLRLPLFIHLLFIRIVWLCGHRSQPETKQQVIDRIHTVLDEALQVNEDVLIVGHGGLMIFMRKELLRRGFAGPSFQRASNGKLYVYDKNH
ncbi:histidine phosphatase family protein [Bacillus solitudinis]|uniref:histidine phosphatase family protein n=1 Tax=Bacillus solitudinis TaxID=2014074 RepID=UPI000C244A67|nr:histidine phosphatase family protein [Bacillus solitudinis]